MVNVVIPLWHIISGVAEERMLALSAEEGYIDEKPQSIDLA